MKRHRFLAGLASSVVPIAAGGLSSAPITAAPTGDQPVVMRWGTFLNYQPVYVGAKKGLFSKHGIDVQFVGNFTSGPAVVQAAGSGSVDVGHVAISGLANAINAGIPVLGVADSQTEFKDAPLMQWFVLDNSPIRTPGDLKGVRIGINALSGSFFYAVLEYIRKAGLSRADLDFVVLPHDRQEQALRSRQIDVAGLIDPYSIAIQATAGVRLLFRAVDVIGERQFSLVFVNGSFLQAHPDAVRRFVSGYRESIDFINHEPEQSATLMSEALHLPRTTIVHHRFTPHANVILRDVAYWLNLMRKGGELKDDGRLKPADVATVQFNI